MEHPKKANADHPVHDLIADRFSPYGFSDRMVSRDEIRSVFEAARWAPSSYNEQPWAYIVATRDDRAEFDRLLSCLVEPNQAWAKAAPVLALGCTRLKFMKNGQPNGVAVHDLGLAAGNLCLEATARGLCVHQMGGILPAKARVVYQVPDDVQVLTALAIGYAADPASLPEQLRARDLAPRTRKPITEFVFGGSWGKTSEIVT